MRALWTGSISFGLVNIPVKLLSATNDRAISFRLLEKRDMAPVSYLKVKRGTTSPLGDSDIVRGFEYEKGRYMTLGDEDFKCVRPGKSDLIDIVQFADEETIDRRLYERAYILEPDRKAMKPYLLLRDALEKSGKVGIARFVMHEREHIAAIKPEGKVLMLEQLRFPDELRDTGSIKVPSRADYSKKEIDLAMSLVDQLSQPFDPSEYKDTYTEDLLAIIRAKAKGRVKEVKEPPPRQPVVAEDILEMLRQSLEKTERQGHAHARS